MEDGGVDECGSGPFDWEYWRRFDAINEERKRKGEALMAEEREMQKYSLVGAHEDGRQAEGAPSRGFWRPGAGSRMLEVPVRRSVE